MVYTAYKLCRVALFTRAWIEMALYSGGSSLISVALFTRAWIEIPKSQVRKFAFAVALFTRAWIEMSAMEIAERFEDGRPLHEGVD